ncbi:hypothetical protein [Amycolatopsis kentuckyensis]|uniref:hypothetical protein n=1 Tax=Amycolatopsis kentuckyensis TaxID=218823 RepID=UPI003568446D
MMPVLTMPGCTALTVTPVSRQVLTENTIRHTTSTPTLRLDLRRGRLTVAVLDDDPHAAVLLPRPTPGASGLGLHIVAQPATHWGCGPRWSGGKAVRAILTSDRHSG